MERSFSILHISDLHRSASEPISNAELISALVSDRDRYVRESPGIPSPQAIVVSGDIIQGVSLNSPDFEKSLTQQYETAKEFLIDLTNRFLNGDRSKVIIIPGNHDVDWNTAFKAMKKLESSDLPKDFANQLLSDKSLYRWDWKTFSAYQIIDLELYEKRLDYFWQFFEEFYIGAPGLFKVVPGADANLYSLFDGKIGVAAFNSCHGNDCFAFHGKIPMEAISKSHLDFIDGQPFNLLISVWHHNFEGPPYRTDYMDINAVKSMIGRGYRLGLYGHHHKAQAAPHQIWLPDNERMAVVSAGSLCAGSKDLPTGFTRQYNIIEISESFKSVKVHVREMATSNIFSKGRLVDFGGKSYAELDWDLPKNSVGGTVDTELKRMRDAIVAAEQSFKSNDPTRALKILLENNADRDGYGKMLLLKSANQCNDWNAIIKATDPPQNIDETVQRVNAYCNISDFVGAQNVLEFYSQSVGLPQSIESELRRRIETLKSIKR